jgi:hypothetical protein
MDQSNIDDLVLEFGDEQASTSTQAPNSESESNSEDSDQEDLLPGNGDPNSYMFISFLFLMYEFKTHYDLCPNFTPNPTQVN